MSRSRREKGCSSLSDEAVSSKLNLTVSRKTLQLTSYHLKLITIQIILMLIQNCRHREQLILKHSFEGVNFKILKKGPYKTKKYLFSPGHSGAKLNAVLPDGKNIESRISKKNQKSLA